MDFMGAALTWTILFSVCALLQGKYLSQCISNDTANLCIFTDYFNNSEINIDQVSAGNIENCRLHWKQMLYLLDFIIPDCNQREDFS